MYRRGKMREVEARRTRKVGVVGCVSSRIRNRKPERSEPRGIPRENGVSSRPT